MLQKVYIWVQFNPNCVLLESVDDESGMLDAVQSEDHMREKEDTGPNRENKSTAVNRKCRCE